MSILVKIYTIFFIFTTGPYLGKTGDGGKAGLDSGAWAVEVVVTGGSDGVAALKAWEVGDGNFWLVSEVDALNFLKLEPKKHFVSLLFRLF